MPHTKGPWVVCNDIEKGTPDISSLAPDVMGNIICEAPVEYMLSMAAWEDNSRLIIAAPDLLTACQKLLAYHRWAKGGGHWRVEPMDPEEEAAAAIARATLPNPPESR